ncbi:MAG TPA: Ig-like domain-containing protein [Solirubrobacteraceae bacterium]
MRRTRRVPSNVSLLLGACSALVVLLAGATAAPASPTTYIPGSPVVDGVSGGPWNTSQGNPAAGSPYQSGDLFPTYTPGGSATSMPTEPNLAVYPAASGLSPLPSGVAGTPGPLTGYCGSTSNETGTPVGQPAGTLPFAPYYFPDVVRNQDGSLTGYFDYRPKDADEAITVARSTDGGASWSTEGEALEQNPGYCPTADTNDDGQGHPFVMSVAGQSHVYTLQRPAGDTSGIGLLVHSVAPSAANPLSGVPASERVGIDPNTFATGSAAVPTSGGSIISLTTLGMAGSADQIVAGPYEDVTQPGSSLITCTGTGAAPASLTGCTTATAFTVAANDDLVQVIATANPGAGSTYAVPFGPNTADGSGGLGTIKVVGATSVSPITTYILNNNAPNRVYIDGSTVYCAQSNANPTNKIENCTTTNPIGLTVHQGDPITADPILPASARMTTGLIAPDGIVGTLPSYPGASAGSTVVLYTEKILADFVVGTVNGYVDSSSRFQAKAVPLPEATINYTPSVTTSEPLPASGSFTIYLGTAVGSPIQAVTCTGFTSSALPSGAPAGSVDLTGCSGGTGGVAVGNWVGGPNAATVPFSVLNEIGEGNDASSKGPEKLFGNNEDYTVLRAASTTDGVNFTDLGAISGTTSGTGNDTGSYDDISNPLQTTSPSATSPTSLAAGSPDTTQLRFVGSRGTIITNPDGSFGMFLSGAWASDGDSDAYNQVFYTTSSDGRHWSVPKVVIGTDYTFAASAAQDTSLAGGHDTPLGISAYYSGRAYGPSVVQNPDGTLTMVFSGYRIPKPIVNAGTVLGTDSTMPYTVGATDPALYRNILTLHLRSMTTPRVPTTTWLSSSDHGSGLVGAPVTYTATVSVNPPGTGLPTGTVAFSDRFGLITGCAAQPLGVSSPDTATCATTHAIPIGSDQVTATYGGDSNYATSSGTLAEQTTATVTITGTSGPVIVKAGESVYLAPGSSVDASVIVDRGGILDAEGARINGALDASGPAEVRVCSTQVAGALSVTGSTGLVVVGDDEGTPACAGNRISGSATLSNNTAGVEFDGDTVGGSASVLGNTGSVPPPDTGSVRAVGDHVSGSSHIQTP